MDKAKRIAELEAELAELTKPVLLRVRGKDVKVVEVERTPRQKTKYAYKGKGQYETAYVARIPIVKYVDED